MNNDILSIESGSFSSARNLEDLKLQQTKIRSITVEITKIFSSSVF